MNEIAKTRILMVCLGNICRSPLAEGIMRKLIYDRGLDHLLEVDSAGTSGLTGEAPDHRSCKVASQNGFSLNHVARKIIRGDFARFDFILVMDESNLHNTLKMTTDENEAQKVKIITDYDMRSIKPAIVADPYWGEMDDFHRVYEQLVCCCEGWLKTHYQHEMRDLSKIS